ncbi:hypothetical protein [Tautonia sociabilis]|uniref:Uncharacterized protein n=1 Tax=Tautonia sociabilis TaxID=2080755 RepID=A0A432MFT3_9BACT|nr:hypothetical protein [Tautonia sociabilis]RUL85285.1 hypothetical protein TsocGM_18935 [Tautonia sociabilis]
MNSTPDPAIPAVGASRTWAFALAAGLLAGGLAAAAVEGTYQTFRPGLVPEVINGETNMVAPPHEIARATRQNASLSFGLMGGLLGLAMGWAGGLAGRSGRGPTARAALLGLVVGLAATALASFLVIPAYFEYDTQVQANQGENLIIPLLVHVGSWAAAGAAGGLAFGVGLGGTARGLGARTAIGGLTGAAVGAVAYELIGGIAFPMAKTPQPFAEQLVPRALAMLLTCTFASALAAFSAVDAERGRRPT